MPTPRERPGRSRIASSHHCLNIVKSLLLYKSVDGLWVSQKHHRGPDIQVVKIEEGEVRGGNGGLVKVRNKHATGAASW